MNMFGVIITGRLVGRCKLL